MCVLIDVKDSIMESEMVIKGGFRFCNYYLMTFGTKLNSITYLTATKYCKCNHLTVVYIIRT